MGRKVVVFFCEMPDRRPMPWRTWFKAWRRGKTAARRAMSSFLMRWATSGRWSHVMFSDQGVVLACEHRGDRFWALHDFIAAYPYVSHGYIVDAPENPGFDQHVPRTSMRRIWPSVVRWITGGLTPAQNCVTVTCDYLRRAGVNVPRRTWSPDQLDTWLERDHEQQTPTEIPARLNQEGDR